MVSFFFFLNWSEDDSGILFCCWRRRRMKYSWAEDGRGWRGRKREGDDRARPKDGWRWMGCVQGRKQMMMMTKKRQERGYVEEMRGREG